MLENSFKTPKTRTIQHRKRCWHCHKTLNKIVITPSTNLEWVWDGNGYDICNDKDHAYFEVNLSVICPYCLAGIGDAKEFGFGKAEIPISGLL